MTTIAATGRQMALIDFLLFVAFQPACKRPSYTMTHAAFGGLGRVTKEDMAYFSSSSHMRKFNEHSTFRAHLVRWKELR